MVSSHDKRRDPDQRGTDVAPQSLRVFINYRHEDTWGEALLLFDRLANHLGAENVFLDVRSLQPGMKWLKEIKDHLHARVVFLALIGPHWMASLKAREEASVAEPSQDYVRFEIEHALERNSGIDVIPVLVGDAIPPPSKGLPRSLEPLTKIEVEEVRPGRFEEDLAHLVGRIETIGIKQSRVIAPVTNYPVIHKRQPVVRKKSIAPAPDAAQIDVVLRHMVDEGSLVLFLGSRLMAGHAGWHEGCGSLPDAQELAADLARRFSMASAHPDLPEVAQYVYVTRGRPDLYRTLRQILTADCEPGPVHRFLARFPGMLDRLGLEKRYLLIVSTSFDMALEKAFDEEGEPYDLAMYMASGPDKGKFVHFPYKSSPQPIDTPNRYGKFPIGDYGELERTVLVKIHGAVDGAVSDYHFKENYVITEDHYIDFLSRSPVESLVPVQILDKLRDSHCLFLGYPIRDWNLRVLLRRIWQGEPLDAKSWSVEPDPDMLEKEFWSKSSVDLYTADPADYVSQLGDRLAVRAHRVG
jgi:SIR2-like domain/TIR domain